jgi:peptide-methionine (S)-S-oxide reductase
MTLRLLATSLGIVLALGLAGGVLAQEKTGSAQAEKEQGATADAPNGKQDPGAAKGKKDAAPPKAKKAAAAPKGKTDADAAKGKNDGEAPQGTIEKATFGGGCFWCTEAVFERIPGVKSVVSGYAGGNAPFPTYEMVQTGLTGHAEVVQIQYDPAVVSYEKLLKVFFSEHDPTTLNQQGPDSGTEYRSIILYHNEEQKEAAKKMYKELTARHVFRSRIVTQLVPFTEFYPAEDYHQDYFRNNQFSEYSQIYIAPKLRRLKVK